MSDVSQGAQVGLIMGSDSDWPTMEAAAEALAEFGIRFEVGVVSAHRTPQRMLDYAANAAGRGIKVIIAGAGGAAHLPGMVASATPLPVIGVPVPLKYLDGMDSLLSIVQMPAGVPGGDRVDRRRAQRGSAGGTDPRRVRSGAARADGAVPGGSRADGAREGRRAAAHAPRLTDCRRADDVAGGTMEPVVPGARRNGRRR